MYSPCETMRMRCVAGPTRPSPTASLVLFSPRLRDRDFMKPRAVSAYLFDNDSVLLWVDGPPKCNSLHIKRINTCTQFIIGQVIDRVPSNRIIVLLRHDCSIVDIFAYLAAEVGHVRLIIAQVFLMLLWYLYMSWGKVTSIAIDCWTEV